MSTVKKNVLFHQLDKGEPRVSLDAHEMHDETAIQKPLSQVNVTQKLPKKGQPQSYYNSQQEIPWLCTVYPIGFIYHMLYPRYRLICFSLLLFSFIVSLCGSPLAFTALDAIHFRFFTFDKYVLWLFSASLFVRDPLTEAIIIGNEPFFWRFFQCRCCYCRRQFFLSFRSSHLPLAVLRSTKCVWFFWFTVRTFRAAGNLHREIFFSFVRIITFFLWFISSVGLCVNRMFHPKKMRERKNKSTKFSLRRKPIYLSTCRTIDWK